MKDAKQTYLVTYTDTFGGELNYSWAKRITLEYPENKKVTNRILIRDAKRELGITLPHRVNLANPFIDIRFRNTCLALTIESDY
jgi:hypothetical protein